MKTPFVLVLLVVQHLAFAGDSGRSVVLKGARALPVTGDLRTDLLSTVAISQETTTLPLNERQKSPWLAAGLSAIVPGAGEFYAESYWKAAAFLAVDVALLAMAYSFDRKAEKQDAINATFADEHWSAERYAMAALALRYLDSAKTVSYAQRMFNNNPNLPSWERINWDVLHEMEREIGATAQGRSFSHTLPRRPEQQYFELIGKYGQYTLGWDDHVGPYNPNEEQAIGRFKSYAADRARTEDFFSTASTFVTLTIVNHLLSAIDAAWTASTFNKRLHTSIEIQRVPTRFGWTSVPVARVEYSF